MIEPVSMAKAHMECRYLKETVPVLIDLLAFEKVGESPGEVTLKHPNTDWLIVVHEAGADAPVKQMHNHFGVRVATTGEVDAAYEYLSAHREEYGLKQIGKPLYNHGSYSLYFLEPGTNGWEIECYETFLRKETGEEMMGAVRASHWDSLLSSERFPGKGYVPQAFTHGTLACDDLKPSRDFCTQVLGLEIHRANENVFYVKHPREKCYVVYALRKNWTTFSPNFRFTINLESKEAVTRAHRWLGESGKELGVTELGDLETDGTVSLFFLSDPNKNWWEVSSLS